MKKVFWSLFVAFAVFSPLFVSFTQASTTPACYNLTNTMYYGKEQGYTYLIEWANTYRRGEKATEYSQVISSDKAQIIALHSFLEAEGFTIASNEKSSRVYGVTTASAVSGFQEKNMSSVLTPRGLKAGNGLLDIDTRNALNQKYGCIGKATVDLTEPNTGIVRARGEVLPIKWNAAKIPNKADLVINYVKSNGTGTTTIATQTIKNGKGSYDWTVPTDIALGTYKVQLQLTGVTKSDISTASFEIREKAIEILAPTNMREVKAGDSVAINWKTSSTIKPTDKVKIKIAGTLEASGSASTTIQIAEVLNNGSYIFVVPQRLNDKFVTGASTFKILLEAQNGVYSASTPDVLKIIPSNNAGVTLTLTSPKTNKDYLVGDKIPLRWTSTGLKATDEVEIGLSVNKGSNTGDYRIIKTKNNGVYDWVVPSEIRSGISLATTTSNMYSITLYASANTSVKASTSNFNIVPDPVASIKVLSPNDDTTKTGKSFSVTWESFNLSKAKTVSVELIQIDGDALTIGTIKSGLPISSSNLLFTLPVNGSLGTIRGIGTNTAVKYKIRVKAVDVLGKIIALDQSDNEFKITK